MHQRAPSLCPQENTPGPPQKSSPGLPWTAHHTQRDSCATNSVHIRARVPPSHFSRAIPCRPGSRALRHLQAAQSTYKFTGRGQNFSPADYFSCVPYYFKSPAVFPFWGTLTAECSSVYLGGAFIWVCWLGFFCLFFLVFVYSFEFSPGNNFFLVTFKYNIGFVF